MRTLCLAGLMLFAAPAAALAYCPSVPDDASTHYVENRTALTLCQQSELNAAASARARDLQMQAELAAQQANFAQELRMQQTFAAANAAASVPAPAF